MFSPQQFAAFVERETGKQIAVKRVLTDVLYSAWLLPTTTPADQYRFFATGVGQQGQGYANPLTVRETNLPNNAQLPRESTYAIHAIGVHVAFEKVKDATIGRPHEFQNFLNHATLILDLIDYRRTIGPVWAHPAGGGPYGMTMETGESVMENGAPGTPNMRTLPVPIVVPGGSNFSIVLELGGADGFTALTNDQAFDVWIMLHCTKASHVVNG